MSYRDPDEYKLEDHYILEHTYEAETANFLEAECLKEYKKTVKLIETKRQRLNEIKKQIETLSSTVGINTVEINNLNSNYARIAKQIESDEKHLTFLANNQFLQEVIKRKRAEQYRIEAGLALEANLRFAAEAEEKAKQESEKDRQQRELQNQKTQGNNFNYTLLKLFLMQLSLVLPLIMIDAPIWLMTIVTLIVFSPLIFNNAWLAVFIFHLYNIVRPILYICGIIVTAQGTQDFVAIAFYIIAGIQSISMIKNFIYTILIIIVS